jgi:hypothetical protein
VAQLYPQALGSLFVVSYDSQGYGGGIRPLSTRETESHSKVEVKVTLRLTVSQSVSLGVDIYYCLTVTVLFFLWRPL